MRAPRQRQQTELFELGGGETTTAVPLAERMRPLRLDEFEGQAHLVGPGRFLSEMVAGQNLHSMILWGPPGTGKTTLARLLGKAVGAHSVSFSAVLSGVKELRLAIDEAREHLRRTGRKTVLLVDEIHRFNKAQQDALLPHVEAGTVVLIAATTENPSFEVISPLLSRTRVLMLEPLRTSDLERIAARALADAERGLGARSLALEEPALRFLVDSCDGDARRMLNALEAAADLAARGGVCSLSLGLVEEAVQLRALRYDRAGEQHYDVVSAFIKSMRGSDPDAAVYWLMRMLEAGEDPLFVARRMVIFAAEDVGNADPGALSLAVAARDAVHFVGLPEGRIPLAQVATYLACAPKSNAAYKAMLLAAQDARDRGPLPVPLHLRNAPTPLMRELGYGRGYEYDHDYEGHVAGQRHLPDELRGRRYYEPSDNGKETEIRRHLEGLRAKREGR